MSVAPEAPDTSPTPIPIFIAGGIANYMPLEQKTVTYTGADSTTKALTFYLYGSNDEWVESDAVKWGEDGNVSYSGKGYTGFKGVSLGSASPPTVVYVSPSPTPTPTPTPGG